MDKHKAEELASRVEMPETNATHSGVISQKKHSPMRAQTILAIVYCIRVCPNKKLRAKICPQPKYSVHPKLFSICNFMT